ncbi:hypothetical protein TNCV_3724461 [Trichonephila clavipes]|nr:hypothetical protein TNCV_3724461 [Trichonephila clavipes]
MGTRLRKLILVYSKKKLSDGKTIGGKGRLTDSLIDKLAHYYGNAIRCNSTRVKEMLKAIWAVWGPSCSTDDEPKLACNKDILDFTNQLIASN